MITRARASAALYLLTEHGSRVGLAACEYHLGLCYLAACAERPTALVAELARAAGPVYGEAAPRWVGDLRCSRPYLTRRSGDAWEALGHGAPPCRQPWRVLGATHAAQSGISLTDWAPHLSEAQIATLRLKCAALSLAGPSPLDPLYGLSACGGSRPIRS